MKPGGLLEAIIELSHERGLDQDAIVEAIEDAIVGAAYRKYKNYKNIEAELNLQTGDIDLMHYKVVVDHVKDPDNEILLDEVIKLDPLAESGDEVEYEIDSKEFKSVIAQTARQLIFQKIREAERESVIEKYAEKKGEIIHGTVSRIERGRVIITVGNAVEAALEYREQIPFEKLQTGENVRVLLIDLLSDGRGPQLIVSRTHPNFLIKLFEVEVPEVYDGIIEVVAAAREPGKRAKVAVFTNDSDVDPVGACVGMRGSRVQSIVSELCGERIDVIEWSERLEQFIANSLAPADIIEIDLDEANGSANIKIAQDQLSLAIGKQGQNVRLASKLTGIMININPWEPEPEPERNVKAEESSTDIAEDTLSDQEKSEATETDAAEDAAEMGNEAIETVQAVDADTAPQIDIGEKANEAIETVQAVDVDTVPQMDVGEKVNEAIDTDTAPQMDVEPDEVSPIEDSSGAEVVVEADKPVGTVLPDDHAETVVRDEIETVEKAEVSGEMEAEKKLDDEIVEVAEPDADKANGESVPDTEVDKKL